MQTPGPLEIVVILVVALLVFGPNKLPEIGRQAGKAMREFRKFQSSFRDEVRDFVDPDKPEPPKKWMPSPGPHQSPVADEVVDAEIVADPAPNGANSAAEAPPTTERDRRGGSEEPDTSPGPTTT